MNNLLRKLNVAPMAGLLAVTLIAAPATAGEVTVFALEIDGLHGQDGSGLYDRIIGEVEYASAPSIKVLPPNRAFSEFEKCAECCISPVNTNPEFYDFDASYIQSDVLTEAAIFIWTAPGTDPVADLGQLAGQRVGARVGMPYGRSVEDSGLPLKLAPTIQSNIKKVQAGRLDAFLAYVPDAYAAFEAAGVEPFPHAETPVARHPDTLLCKPGGDTEAFLTEFNAGLQAMVASGRLDEIAGE